MYEDIRKITSANFLDILIENGFNFFSGVPDSILQGILAELKKRKLPYVDAPCEDVAVGVCVGAKMAGRKPCLLMQNSGLGNATDAILTLNTLYKIPILFVIVWRGYDHNDEIQHWDWGDITDSFLDAIKIPYILIDNNNAEESIRKASEMVESGKSVGLLLRRGYIDETR